jgi:ribosome-associated heat shock protein Hsp15
MSVSQEDRDWQRLDIFLWSARFLKTRSDCVRLVTGGLLRLNRQPTDKAHARVRVGDVLTLPLPHGIRVVRVQALATRRGPATEARSLYAEIDDNQAAASCAATQTAAYPPV